MIEFIIFGFALIIAGLATWIWDLTDRLNLARNQATMFKDFYEVTIKRRD